MIASAFDLGEHLTLKTVEYKLHQDLWGKYDLTTVNLAFDTWVKIKYLNVAGTALHADVETIPNNSGGLYLFYLQCPVVVGLTEYPFYVGRAQFTAGQNLQKRCKEYYQHYVLNKERPKITRMLRYWGNELYLAYKVIPDNADTVDFEKKLINTLLLPMNDQIPDQEIRQAVQAFNV